MTRCRIIFCLLCASLAWASLPQSISVAQDSFGFAAQTRIRDRLVTNANAAVANIFAYDAFGTLIASNATPQTVYLFAGEQRDSTLGLYYLRARYLNTGTGRFWTRDSFEGVQTDPPSLHKYLYVHCNPVSNIDPSGNETLIGIMSSMTSRMRVAASYIGSVAARAGPLLKKYFTSPKMARRAALGAAGALVLNEYADFYIPPTVDELVHLSNELGSFPSLPNGKSPSAEVMRLAVLGAEVQEQLAAGAVSAPLRAQLPPYNWVRMGVLSYEGFSYLAHVQQTVSETSAGFGVNMRLDITEWKIIWFTLTGQLDPAGDVRTFREAAQAYKQRDMATLAMKATEIQKRLDKYGTVTITPTAAGQNRQ